MANDDPFAVQTPDEQRNSQLEYRWHQDQRRRSQDTIRVSNPTNADFYVEWENLKHRVPTNGTVDFPRYLAQKYVRDMTVQIINQLGEQEGQEMIKKAAKNNPEILHDKYLENKAVWDKVPRTDNPQLMAKYYDELWVGLVHEFGLDDVPQAGVPINDFRSEEEKLFQKIGDKRVLATDSLTAFEPESVDKQILEEEFASDT